MTLNAAGTKIANAIANALASGAEDNWWGPEFQESRWLTEDLQWDFESWESTYVTLATKGILGGVDYREEE